MANEMVRAADVVARRLYAAGCRRAFGMPGGEVLTLVDALEAAGIAFVLCKHETAAGFLAEGAHHVDGAPAILVATVGPGAMNAVNFVANAAQDCVPVIVLTGCVDADEAESYTHQVLDHRRVFEEITKATFTLTPGACGIVADKAVAIATQGRSGPVHIDVPISVADAMVPAQGWPQSHAPAAVRPVQACVDQFAGWLETAKTAVMIVGLDAVKEDAGAALLAFVEEHEVPFVTTYKAKGIIPEDHPLCLGGAGLSPKADARLVPLFQGADLVICAGYDPIEMRVGWRNVWDVSRQNVVDITHAPCRHGMHLSSLEINCNISDVLSEVHVDRAADTSAARAVKAALQADFAAGDWGPDAVIETCRDVSPKGTIATVDSGAHRILLSQMWRCDGPRQLLQSTGLCTMGCALPLAAGAKLAAPDVPVIGFMGDAGFLMVTGELSTVAELQLPVIYVVFVDASLSLIELKQRQRQMKNVGVDFGQHDFAAIGRAFGGNGVTVESRGELEAALRDALVADRFTVIAAQIERGAYDGRI